MIRFISDKSVNTAPAKLFKNSIVTTPIAETCVSVAHLTNKPSPYWELRRKVLAIAEAVELEKNSPDRDAWADKFAIETGIGL